MSGLIGHAISSGKKSACVGETEIGIGQTSAWKICTISPRTAEAVYFEVVTPAGQRFSLVHEVSFNLSRTTSIRQGGNASPS